MRHSTLAQIGLAVTLAAAGAWALAADRYTGLRRRELETYQRTGRKPQSKTFGALMCEVARIAGVVRSGVDA
mgnify:CR=1 FL=1